MDITPELIAAITGLISGLFGLIFGFNAITHNRYLAVNEYLSTMYDEKFLAARKHVYHQYREGGENFSVDDELAAEVINFYHIWGTMARHGYLPMWVFREKACGPGVIRLYEILEPLIRELRQKHEDVTYANGFTWLYEKLGKMYHKQLEHIENAQIPMLSEPKNTAVTTRPVSSETKSGTPMCG